MNVYLIYSIHLHPGSYIDRTKNRRHILSKVGIFILSLGAILNFHLGVFFFGNQTHSIPSFVAIVTGRVPTKVFISEKGHNCSSSRVLQILFSYDFFKYSKQHSPCGKYGVNIYIIYIRYSHNTNNAHVFKINYAYLNGMGLSIST